MRLLLGTARLLFALLVLLAGTFVATQLSQGRLDTDVLALLPADGDQALARASAAGRADVLIWLEGEPQRVDAARQWLVERLLATGEYRHGDSGDALLTALAPLRYRTLASGDRAALARGDESAVIATALERLAQPLPLGQFGDPAQDPLLTFERALTERLTQLAPPSGASGELLHLRLRGDALDLALQERVEAQLVAAIDAAQRQFNVRIAATGVVRHAAANASRARSGAERVATLSTVLVVALALWAFRAVAPMLATFVPVLAGTTLGYAAAFALFPRLHVLTLVFGATLVGSASDYAFHFLCARTEVNAASVRALARRLAGPLAWSAGSAAAAYACMSVVGVSALAQIGLIGGVGLLAAAAAVLLWLPLLGNGLSLARPPLPRLLRALRERSARAGLATVVLSLVFAAVALAWQGKVSDDVRALDASPQALRAETARVMSVAGGADQGVFVLVRAADPAAWQAREQALTQVLDPAVARADLGGYLAISRLWPSAARQTADAAALQRLLRPDGAAADFLRSIGGEDWSIAWRRGAAEDALRSADDAPPAALTAAVPGLWLGADATGYASVVRLRDPSPISAARARLQAALPAGSQWVDVPERLTASFARLARSAAQALGAALVIVALGLALWRRRARAVLAVLPAGAAVAGALGLAATVADGLDLFRILGGFLVLALATDFIVLTIAEDDERTVLGMLLGALTTAGAFAALALLPIPAVQGFGMVVAVGTALALVLTTVARRWLVRLAGGSRS